MSFLPEHDRDFFELKEIAFEEVAEGETKAVILSDVPIPPGLFKRQSGVLVPCDIADIMVMVPKTYSDAKLDSFFVIPWLFLPSGAEPRNTGHQMFAGREWQFWSRHQDGWRPGIDGFDTFIPLIREALLAK
ncbi:MAG TPA: E2/UBC family protein [Allosphingosinicella sp.]|nr:E2/UBC family protein [Allosphingosinicella sp.]